MTTVHINDLSPRARELRERIGGWPWTVVGVFSPDDEIPEGETGAEWWHAFCYTVGLPVEVWAPCASIESRAMGFDLTAAMLNVIAAGVTLELVGPGDTVTVPLGVVGREGEDDVDSQWWLGHPEPTSRRQCYQSRAEQAIPILWSSPLGWKEAS